jgi:hypothetical protein
MHARFENPLETRLAEVLIGALFPCDLGDGIEVLHDVEMIEIEMECDLGEDAWDSTPYEKIELVFEAVVMPFEDLSKREPVMLDLGSYERNAASDTVPFETFEPSMPFVRIVESVLNETVPYPRL